MHAGAVGVAEEEGGHRQKGARLRPDPLPPRYGTCNCNSDLTTSIDRTCHCASSLTSVWCDLSLSRVSPELPPPFSLSLSAFSLIRKFFVSLPLPGNFKLPSSVSFRPPGSPLTRERLPTYTRRGNVRCDDALTQMQNKKSG